MAADGHKIEPSIDNGYLMRGRLPHYIICPTATAKPLVKGPRH
jgi:hypothetical protein